jgi:hypothetical protein
MAELVRETVRGICEVKKRRFQPVPGCGLPNIFYATKNQPVPGWKMYFKTKSGMDSILLAMAKRATPKPGTGSILYV